jgi:hypothetical protein
MAESFNDMYAKAKAKAKQVAVESRRDAMRGTNAPTTAKAAQSLAWARKRTEQGTRDAVRVGNENIKKVYETIRTSPEGKYGVSNPSTAGGTGSNQVAAPDWGNRVRENQTTSKVKGNQIPMLENPSLVRGKNTRKDGSSNTSVQDWMSANPKQFRKIIGNK